MKPDDTMRFHVLRAIPVFVIIFSKSLLQYSSSLHSPDASVPFTGFIIHISVKINAALDSDWILRQEAALLRSYRG